MKYEILVLVSCWDQHTYMDGIWNRQMESKEQSVEDSGANPPSSHTCRRLCGSRGRDDGVPAQDTETKILYRGAGFVPVSLFCAVSYF